MYRGSRPRILPLIIVIIVVALVIASIVTIGRMIFGGNASKDTQKTPETTVVDSVLNQDGARSVRWTVRGPIVADEKYRSYQITVSPTKRSFVSYSGYLEQVLDSKTYENNAKAYVCAPQMVSRTNSKRSMGVALITRSGVAPAKAQKVRSQPIHSKSKRFL